MSKIEDILKLNDLSVICSRLTSRKKPFKRSLADIMREWNPMEHKVMDELVRKDKKIKKDTGVRDTKGNPILREEKVKRVRVAIPVQRVLVERMVGFLLGIPVEYKKDFSANEKADELYREVMQTFKDNKIKYFDKRLAREVSKVRECAELWYMTLDDNGKPNGMRVKLLSPSKGDSLYPHFNDYDKMDGFVRKYTYYNEVTNEEEIRMDIYTDKFVYQFAIKDKMPVSLGEPLMHGFTKVPVIYFRQEEAEWESVQPAIDRLEELLSNWGDTNDYFGAPSYFFKGKLKGFAEKGETGRVYQGEGDADMKVLSWDSSPTSMTGEMQNLINVIFSYTQTPDISFENMKTLGNNTSGVAIKLMFTDPHLKAETKIETYGELFTRRFNLVKDGVSNSLTPYADNVVKMVQAEPIFTPYLPKNELEEMQIINASTGGKPTMSQEEGVKQNPRINNPDEVLSQLKNEALDDIKDSIFGGGEVLEE